jgi:hypothetical protein
MTTTAFYDDPSDYLKSPEQRQAEDDAQAEIVLREQGISLAYKRLFGTEDGEKVLKHLSDQCYENAECFFQTDYQNYVLGKRSVMLFIRGQLDRKIE